MLKRDPAAPVSEATKQPNTPKPLVSVGSGILHPSGPGVLSQAALDDLLDSGLDAGAVAAMQVRHPTMDDLAQLNLQDILRPQDAYLMPYFESDGTLTDPLYYRIKILHCPANVVLPKYIQPSKVPARIYLPPLGGAGGGGVTWDQVLEDPSYEIVITEGEKKAQKACLHGIWCIGLGGVWSWRTRTLRFPLRGRGKNPGHSGHDVTVSRDSVTVRFDESSVDVRRALTFGDMVCEDLFIVNWVERLTKILFDNDPKIRTRRDVQFAAWELSEWLVGRGARTRQKILLSLADLPWPAAKLIPAPHQKLGLDDFLLQAPGAGVTEREAYELLPERPVIHPEPRFHLDKILNKTSNRSDMTSAAHAAVAFLDNEGRRYLDPETQTHYYFHEGNHNLYRVSLAGPAQRETRLTPFGSFLQSRLGVNDADTLFQSHFASAFANFPGTLPATIRRVCHTHHVPKTPARTPDSNIFYFQLDNATLARVTSQGFQIVPNGFEGQLFLPDFTASVNPQLVEEKFHELDAQRKPYRPGRVSVTDQADLLPCWWRDLATCSFRDLPGMDNEETLLVMASLYYLSPLLKDYRGVKLPIEIYVSEPNSGKTFLMQLRQGILKGNTSLSKLPNNLREWESFVQEEPLLWVGDNIGAVDKEMRGMIQDSLAHLATDNRPHISARKLYTTMDSVHFPVYSQFAFTCIQNPFTNPDVLQRTLVQYLRTVNASQRDPDWVAKRIGNLGEGDADPELRALRLADHCLYIHRFLAVTESEWSPHYAGGHRLPHFEQSMLHMATAMGFRNLGKQAMPKLGKVTQYRISAESLEISGLCAFVDDYLSSGGSTDSIDSTVITHWFQFVDPEMRWSTIKNLTNARLLGRFVMDNAHDVRESTGLEGYKAGNRIAYRIHGANKDGDSDS